MTRPEAAHSPKENILKEECVLPTLHNLILVEAYLAGGPVEICTLWAEMYERQKTINEGLLNFTRAIGHLEENGFMQKVSESRSGITGKGEMYLEVAPQGVAGVSGTVEGHGEGDVRAGLTLQPNTSGRDDLTAAVVAVPNWIPAERRKTRPFKNPEGQGEGLREAIIRSEEPASEYQASPADSQTFFSSLDHFTNRITRCVDKKLGRETDTCTHPRFA